MSQDSENAAFKREISCKLQYLKVPDGKYEVESTEELKFQPPLAVTTQPITRTPTGTCVVQLECKNILNVPAKILGYSFVPSASVKVLTDPNACVVRNYVCILRLLCLDVAFVAFLILSAMWETYAKHRLGPSIATAFELFLRRASCRWRHRAWRKTCRDLPDVSYRDLRALCAANTPLPRCCLCTPSLFPPFICVSTDDCD